MNEPGYQQMSVASLILPKRPRGEGWRRLPNRLLPRSLRAMGYPLEFWFNHTNDLCVISAVEVATPEPEEPELGPEYHVSISRKGERCTGTEAAWVLGEFDLSDAKEDNHVPSGVARNFWRPVADKLSGYECPCQDHEPAIREDKGDFVWRGVTR